MASNANRDIGDVAAAAIPAKKKNVPAEGKNRKALADIGNVADVVGGIDPKKISRRPVTRSFGAQLIAKAQAAQAALNKKIVPVKSAKKLKSSKENLKKVVAKSKSQARVIKEQKSIKVMLPTKKGKSIRKNTTQTLTSLLPARSKTAWEFEGEKEVEIEDVDAVDIQNELAVVEYIEDLYNYYKEYEKESMAHDYINSQPEINVKMRAILIDWLIEVNDRFELRMETLYLTVNIVDRFLSSNMTRRNELQLVGISAILMASKYEEIWAPEVNSLVCVSDSAFSPEQILKMEKRILEALHWNLTVPTPYVFLVRFIKASSFSWVLNEDMKNMSHFLSEMGMMNYSGVLYSPSMIAASAVFAARCTIGRKPYWNEMLKMHTGYKEIELMDTAKLLVKYHSMAAQNKLKSIFKRYSSTDKGVVARIPPAKFLLRRASA